MKSSSTKNSFQSNQNDSVAKPLEPSNANTELLGNRETENQRDRASEKQRNGDSEPQTIQTIQTIPFLSLRVATLLGAAQISLKGGFTSNSIFTLCRALKAFEATNGHTLTKAEQDSAFSLWWNTAKPLLPRDAEFDEYRFEFERTFEKTRTPLGANPLFQAIEQADSRPLPPEAARYGSPKIKRLVAVCFQLQRLAGNAPFFIGARGAAIVLGTKKPETGLTTLDGLVRDGILTVVRKGESGGKLATRYRYIPSS